MSLVGGYSMPQSYGHAPMGHTPSPEALYSPYYSHPSPPGQALYPGWGYSPPGYSPGYSSEVAVTCQEYGVSGGFVVGPGSPHDLGGDYTIEMVDGCGRVVKRRSSANRKERRRTQSINNAFAELRECIPNVPADTKLSKIKTLRLATSYIAYLMEVLHTEDASPNPPPEPFRADLPPRPRPQHPNDAHTEKEESDMETDPTTPPGGTGGGTGGVGGGVGGVGGGTPQQAPSASSTSPTAASVSPSSSTASPTEATTLEKRKGRTGWPETVWAQELKH